MNMLEYKDQLSREGILLSYRGPFTEAMVAELGGTIRGQIEMKLALIGQGKSATISRMFSVFIELSQNVVRYSHETTPNDGYGDADAPDLLRHGVVVIGYQNDMNFVHCGNEIDAAAADSLANRLREIQGMNRDEVNAAYRKKRREKPEPGSLGAGLGLLEMARLGSRLEFDIEAMNTEKAFFTIKVWI
ncbi:MAG: hypothetical protein HQM03_09545 [Magnetococcales bacterium]|nr:hypothetical protein [Magnetococcales bacterium]